MADSTHPLYQKGYRAGRAKTEQEMDALRKNVREGNVAWNQCFLALLPVAMQADGWTIGDRKVTSGADRVELAERWADRAAARMKPV